jgi:hypothetical protein
MHHIAYTPNLIQTPYMQQRETRKEEHRKKEILTPHVTKTHASLSPPTKDTHTDKKKIYKKGM